jgi:glycosyltransferase involved in cell wall biosynthesis
MPQPLGSSSPTISVVVRTLGSARLGDALESLAVQTRQDFEVVVVDMSNGHIEVLLDRFGSRLPSVQRIKPAGRRTRPAALNAGVRAARAPLLAVLDDDNLYDPGHLETLVGGLEASGADYVYTGVRHATYEPSGRLIEKRDVSLPWSFERMILGNFVYATGSAYRRSLWEAVSGYDERFEVFEDWDFIIRASQRGRIEHLNVVSGESRKFTGLPTVSHFDREIGAARRCLAGVYWTHRHLYRGRLRDELKAASAEHCRRRFRARTGLLAKTVGGFRLELGLDLAGWWTVNAAGHPRVAA